jgi:tRNA(Ile)-lysidine synthase
VTPLISSARRALRGAGLRLEGEALLLGLSGGPDSVALLDVLKTLEEPLGYRLIAAHLDHGLRPDSSEDGVFCQDLCDRLSVELRLGSAPVRERALREGGGLEEAARRERYSFLRGLKDEIGAAAIALGHTRDDQAETFLLRLLRGAGASGLASMREVSRDLVRPFLLVSRAEILDHLASRSLSFREDPTNADPAFLRNRVRHELLPYLEARFNPRIREALARTAGLLADDDQWISERAKAELSCLAFGDGKELVLSRPRLQASPLALRRRVVREALERSGGLRGVSAAHIAKILETASGAAPSGRKLPLPGGREVRFSFDRIRLGRRIPPVAPFAFPLTVPGRVEVPGGFAIRAETLEGSTVSKGWEAVVAMPEGEALLVRSARPGDRVSVRGRVRSLRRFFMERRVPADLRRSLPLVAAGEQVLFVPGEVLDLPPEGRKVRIALEGP